MKYRFIFVMLLSCLFFDAAAQKISGKVFDEKTKETLPSCNVYWLNGGGGTITDVDGVFTIVRKKPEQRKLIFSYTGYASDTVDVQEKTNIEVAMRAVGEMLNVVEIKERMKSNYLSKMSLEQKEIISSEGLKHLACCNLGESFENSASVDVGYSDAVSGSKQIQLLGLTGVYSQLLLENMPFLRGLSAPFGLGYVPGNWMESISVSKGVATVKHGYETITGIIDLEYEKPN